VIIDGIARWSWREGDIIDNADIGAIGAFEIMIEERGDSAEVFSLGSGSEF
jgi:hypothetical protein